MFAVLAWAVAVDADECCVCGNTCRVGMRPLSAVRKSGHSKTSWEGQVVRGCATLKFSTDPRVEEVTVEQRSMSTALLVVCVHYLKV
jgi:hypothetical protein